MVDKPRLFFWRGFIEPIKRTLCLNQVVQNCGDRKARKRIIVSIVPLGLHDNQVASKGPECIRKRLLFDLTAPSFKVAMIRKPVERSIGFEKCFALWICSDDRGNQPLTHPMEHRVVQVTCRTAKISFCSPVNSRQALFRGIQELVTQQLGYLRRLLKLRN